MTVFGVYDSFDLFLNLLVGGHFIFINVNLLIKQIRLDFQISVRKFKLQICGHSSLTNKILKKFDLKVKLGFE